MSKKKQLTSRDILLRCCICIGGSIGMIGNCNGIFYTSLAESLDVSVGQVSIMTTIYSIVAAFFGPVCVRILTRKEIQKVTSTGVLLAIATYLLLSVTQNLPMLYATAVLMGISYCMFSNIPVSMLLQSWYGEKNGGPLGLAMAFSGIFGALMNTLLSMILAGRGFRFTYAVMALIQLVLVLPAARSVRMNPDAEARDTSVAEGEEPARAVSGSQFVLLAVTCSLFCFLPGLNQHLPALAQSMGESIQSSASLLTACMLGNVCWKVLFGRLCDRYNPIRMSQIWLVICASGAAIMLVFTDQFILMRVGAFVYATCFSLGTVGITLLTQMVAGRNYAPTYSKVLICTNITYALTVSFYGLLYDATGSYLPGVVILIGVAFLALILTRILSRKSRQA